GERVVLHDVVHLSFTVPWREELFNFCLVDFDAELETFLARAVPAMAAATNADRLLLDPPGQDDMVFISAVPWFAFTGASQPGDARSGDSFPRFVWGRVTSRDGRERLPLNVQLHHGLADGLHIGRFLERLEAGLAEHARRLTAEVS
ncbi:MAG: CatA-like O-acetyltransferase, partial [Candidatus Sericytochromatia bacterium]